MTTTTVPDAELHDAPIAARAYWAVYDAARAAGLSPDDRRTIALAAYGAVAQGRRES